MTQPDPGQGDPTQHPTAAAPYRPIGVEHPRSLLVFVLGIVGIFVGICAFFAWGFGAAARREINAGAEYPWDGKLRTGYILGKVFSIIYIIASVLTFISMFVLLSQGQK